MTGEQAAALAASGVFSIARVLVGFAISTTTLVVVLNALPHGDNQSTLDSAIGFNTISAFALIGPSFLEAGEVGQIGAPVYIKNSDGLVYLAKANALASASVFGLSRAAMVSVNAVVVPGIQSGSMGLTTAQWDAITGQTGGLTRGSYYYLSQGTAGRITTLKPDSGIVMRVGLATSATSLEVQLGQPF